MSEQPKPIRSERSVNVTQSIIEELEGFMYGKQVWKRVISDLKKREAKGIETYGDSLYSFNGRDATKDLYEELLDALQYAKQKLIEDGSGLHQYYELQTLVASVANELVQEEMHEYATRLSRASQQLNPRECAQEFERARIEIFEERRKSTQVSPPRAAGNESA